MKYLILLAALIHLSLALGRDFFDTTVIPSDILVAVEESIYIKIKNPIASQTECSYKAPGKKEINSPDTFVKFSDDKCGIRIDKVQKSHAGAWKLMSTFKNSSYESSIKGVSVVRVKERAIVPRVDKIYAGSENFAPADVNMSYCYVTKTVGLAKLTEIDQMKCMVPQNLQDDFRDGEWNVRMGVDGESREITFTVNIQSTGKCTIKAYLTRPCRTTKFIARRARI